MRQLAAMDARYKFLVAAPYPSTEKKIVEWIEWAINNMDLDKSAGYDGSVYNCSKKEELLREDQTHLIEATVLRIKRCMFVGSDAGLMTPRDRFLAGMRTPFSRQLRTNFMSRGRFTRW